ncbi:MAG TPA: 23S rRNA (adenine(2503)-C(2))-methyltransferase RlmN [Spirochaetota bacterium]
MSVGLIKNYSLDEAEKLFSEMGEKPFRARQLFSWLYDKNVSSFDEMTNYSKQLRTKLTDNFVVSPLQPVEKVVSPQDNSEKFLFRTRDGHYIESVLLRNDNTEETRITICVSSQIGCAMGCTFCSTAKIGFVRNLEAAEILDQVCQIRRITGIRNDNVVFMGMGEPFLNYDHVIRAAAIFNYSFGFHISVRRITISTCGILPAIERYIDERQPYNLALSLNDTESVKRTEQMPINRSYPIEKIAELLNNKFPVSRNRLTLEYVMRKDNISQDDARRIKRLFYGTKVKLNLIPLNSGAHSLLTPTRDEIERFIKYLEIINVPVSIRKSLGSDIGGACGQLSGKRYDNGVRIDDQSDV